MNAALPWLDAETGFPDPERALVSPPGLLALGGDLSPQRLRQAYHQGIFPWFSEGDPILWWSPDPRCVIAPPSFSPSRSLRRSLRQGSWRLSTDRCFEQVMRACAAPRPYADSTWISEDIIAGYCSLHTLGQAHSIEVWHDDELAGGLYGVSVGRIFCGESMFSRRNDASKIAFWALMSLGSAWRLPLIDCQLENSHLASLGAGPVSRRDYLACLRSVRDQPSPDWCHAGLHLQAAGFSLANEATATEEAPS